MTTARRRPARFATAALATVLLTPVLLAGCSSSARPAGSSSSRPPATTSATPGPAGSSATSAPTVAPAPSGSPSTPATPPATEGGIAAQVPSVAITSLPPVPLATPATAGGIAVTLANLESVAGEAVGPGQIAGPAVRVTVVLRNTTGAAVDVGAVVVDLRDAAGTSASPLSGNGATPFTGSVAPGQSVTGVYVYSLAIADRRAISVAVTYSTAAPVAVFTGDAPQ